MLGKSLLDSGAITPGQLDEALSAQRISGSLLGDVLRSMHLVSDEDLSRALAREAGTPFVAADGLRVDPSAAAFVPERFARRHQLVPMRTNGRSLEVVQANPLDVVSLDELSQLTRRPVVAFCATPEDVRRAIEGCYGPRRPPTPEKKASPRRLSELGLSRKQERELVQLLGRDRGVILVTGPDGAGKRTTVQSAMAWLDAAGRRAFDVGDIRDSSAAAAATRAAQSGHLVFGTLPGKTPADAIATLCGLGLDPHRLAFALGGVIAQRLVRVMCPSCAAPATFPDALLNRVGLDADPGVLLREGRGCHECGGTGYRGRTGIFEVLLVDPSIRTVIEAGADPLQLREAARKAVHGTLADEALTAALFGRTTIEEAAAVVDDTPRSSHA